jgi:hypothetical protein
MPNKKDNGPPSKRRRGVFSVVVVAGDDKKKKPRKMRFKTGRYDAYVRALGRSLALPLPTRDTLSIFNQVIDYVMIGCMKSTHELMGGKRSKITPRMAKMGIISFFTSRGGKEAAIESALKMCTDTHAILRADAE